MNEDEKKRDAFSDYVYTLWRKKYIILAVTLLLGVVAVALLSIKGIVSERYEVEAAVYVGKLPPFMNIESYELQTPAISFEPLFQSTEVVHAVLRAFRQKYPDRAIPLEFFKRRFEVVTKITEDTGIRRRYSSVIELSTYGNSPEEAQFIMQTWVNEIIERFGDLPGQSLRFYLEYYADNLREVQAKIEHQESEYVKVKWDLHAKMKELIDKENILSPATIPLDLQRSTADVEARSVAQKVDILVQSQDKTERPGLLTQLADLDIKIAHLEGLLKYAQKSTEAEAAIETKGVSEQMMIAEQDDFVGTVERELAGAKNERTAMEHTISQVKEDIATLQHEVATLELTFEKLGREVEDLREQYDLFSKLKNQVDSIAGITDYTGEFPPEYRSELRLIAEPIKPELRAYPKRSIFGIVAAIFGFFLSIIIIIVNKYLREIAQRQGEMRS